VGSLGDGAWQEVDKAPSDTRMDTVFLFGRAAPASVGDNRGSRHSAHVWACVHVRVCTSDVFLPMVAIPICLYNTMYPASSSLPVHGQSSHMANPSKPLIPCRAMEPQWGQCGTIFIKSSSSLIKAGSNSLIQIESVPGNLFMIYHLVRLMRRIDAALIGS